MKEIDRELDDELLRRRRLDEELIDAYDDPARPYLAQPYPGAAPRFPHYAQLARVAERTIAEDRE